jgi:hypothetical protein
MEESKRIATTFPPPKFYSDLGEAVKFSRRIYQEDKEMVKSKELAQSELEDDFGHGMEHAKKVSLDAGALVFVEGKKLTLNSTQVQRLTIISQMAGLLHDIKRKEKDHAKASAKRAEELLKHLSFSEEERRYIIDAILNHEALTTPHKIPSPIGQLISDALYDADKFRWGPDNYTDTAWYMADFYNIPIEELADSFQREMEEIVRIKIRESFRTEMGRKYGPEFIDLGLELGKKFADLLKKITIIEKGDGAESKGYR